MDNNEMTFYEAIKALYINPNIIIRRKSWDIALHVRIIEDFDVKIKCENKETGDRHFLDRADVTALDWEIKQVCAS